MERAEWLQQMRAKAEVLYDHFAPFYWIKFGLSTSELHRAFLAKFLARVPSHSKLLSAACGAGRFDGFLLEAGHSVVGIDQSEKMLARAKECFPEARYVKMGLQEMAFQDAFDGAICMDALEHICPEDWPGILQRFCAALKPGGVLYFTADVEEADKDAVERAYARAQARGLPVVYGEVADEVDESHALFLSYENVFDIPADLILERADGAVYHYHPPLAQVRAWLEQAGLAIEEQDTGEWYEHLLVRKPH